MADHEGVPRTYRGTPIRTVRIPDDVWGQVTARADAQGITAGDVIRDALDDHLNQEPPT